MLSIPALPDVAEGLSCRKAVQYLLICFEACCGSANGTLMDLVSSGTGRGNDEKPAIPATISEDKSGYQDQEVHKGSALGNAVMTVQK